MLSCTSSISGVFSLDPQRASACSHAYEFVCGTGLRLFADSGHGSDSNVEMKQQCAKIVPIKVKNLAKAHGC